MILKKAWPLILCICLIGCSEKIPLEKASLILLVALDKSSDDEMKVGVSVPLFHHKEQKNTVEHWVRANSIYSGFSKIERRLTGYITPAKAEIILIGSKLAREDNWFQALDSSFRDPQAAINAKILMVDGDPEKVLQVQRPDKPLLVSYINDVIETSIHSNQAISSTVKQLLKEKNEPGMTQTIPVIKTERNQITTEGLALLNKNGKYLTKITKEDVKIFNLIYKSKKTGRTILHFPLSENYSNQQSNLSVLVKNTKRSINVDFHENKFMFDIDIDLDISLLERTNYKSPKGFEVSDQGERKIKIQIQKELEKKLISMFHDFQKNKIDPIGLSMYAKAYQYNEWKKAKQNWLEHLSKAQININTHIKIKDIGTIHS
ncbi:Ger(x)C family spore germination protein [Bacillus thuringiensis]|uniref:Ger(x)C family spore germination protein n=1 Tax=Bacillus thuringiensis TaxID=1428 RepID=UPI000CF98B94|nr:Ger(x)C family spore germination protein [Bacillus thuringiensis]PQQ47702.1 spore gernimation protein XA [Bacillus thuringiensis]